MPATTTQSRTLKWALPKKATGGRVQKQTRASKSCKSNAAPPIMHHQKKAPQTEMDRLASELAFTYDTLATISVHFESLQLAYTSCQADLKETYCATRLGPKEKELLAAYDDLGLQVVHLERKIKKLETRLEEVRAQEATATASSAVSSLPSSSPASSTCSFDVSPWTCNEPTFVMDDIVTPPYATIDPTAMMNDCTSFINDSYYLYNTDSFDYLMIPSETETYSMSHPDYYYPVLSVQ